MEEKQQRSVSGAKRNKDGWRWRRFKRIGNENFEKLSQFFSNTGIPDKFCFY